MAITKVQKAVQSIAVAAAAMPAVKIEQKIEPKTELEVLIDEVIDLHTRLSEFGAFDILKRLEEAKKALQQQIKDSGADPDQAFTFETDTGTVVFGPCSNTREITDKPKLISVLTPQVFLEVAKVTLTDLKKYLSELEIEKFTTPVKGSRTMKSVTKKVQPE